MFNKVFLSLLLTVMIILGFSSTFPFYCKAKLKTDTLMKTDTLNVKSGSFTNNEFIPSKYCCDAENISPSLEWSGGPVSTKTYALICDDPDAPSKVWVHWIIFNIPSTVTKLDEDIPSGENTSDSILQGTNDSGNMGYSGPCPPSGTHHYRFTIYALDCSLSLKAGVSRDNVDAAMKNHILAQGEIIGLYKREK